MVIGSGKKFRNLISASVKVYDEEIETVQQYTHLGVIFTANMTWTAHIDHLCAKVNKRLGLLKRIKHLLPRYARVLYYNSLVQPLFDYGDLVWGDKNNCTLIQNLQTLQNKAAKVILDRASFSSSTEALKTLGWRDLSQRRHYHRCLYIFKCVNGMTFSDLDLTRISEIHEHNTRSKNSLRLPRVKRNWGKQRLAYHACKDWNSLRVFGTLRVFPRLNHILKTEHIRMSCINYLFKFLSFITFYILLFLEDTIFIYLYFISYSSINSHVYNQICLQDLSENHVGEKVFQLIKIIIIIMSEFYSRTR